MIDGNDFNRECEKRGKDAAVHAHWIHISFETYRCSNCDAQTSVDELFGEPIYLFCPYCSAKMDEEE